MNKLEQTEISEMNGLVPFLDQEELAYLLAHLEPFLKDHDYEKVKTFIDLEQLQITYYPSLFKSAPEILDLIQNSGLFNQHELDFLTIRSLLMLGWPKPESKEHLELMAKTEIGLHVASLRVAEFVRKRHPDRDKWLPYWARLAHFNLLRHLPEPLQSQFGPDGIPCILLRSRDINAHIFPLLTTNAVVLDYALEPFLKNMNAFMHSYYGSRDMAGPKRIQRAFTELLSRVLFFKGYSPAYSLTPFSILFGEDTVQSVKATTDAQISFLIAHEIGHIALNHPGTRTALPISDKMPPNGQIDYYEYDHLYEYEADSFALDWLRSKIINSFRYYLHPKRSQDSKNLPKTIESLIETVSDYGHFYISVETLFIFIEFIESFYERLTVMVPELPRPLQLNTHPHSGERWARLNTHCIYDISLSSEYSVYCRALLNDVLEYMSTLSSKSIDALIKEALKNESQN